MDRVRSGAGERFRDAGLKNGYLQIAPGKREWALEAKARALGYQVIAFTDRAIPDVALGRLRNDAGRWQWDLDATRTLDAGQIGFAPCQSR